MEGGFDPAGSAGFGLRQMRSRAAELGGASEVVSSRGAGTTVRVVLPATLLSPPAGEAHPGEGQL